MVAREPTTPSPLTEAGVRAALSPTALGERLEEEISRAERHGTELSCVLVSVDNLEEMVQEHGSELSEQTLGYVAAALSAELRRFDRVGRPSEGGVLVVLPGTDDTRGEIVARRLLSRLQTIKVESRGGRQPLEVTLGIAAWQAEMSGEDLLRRTQLASRTPNGEENDGPDDPRRAGVRQRTEDRRFVAPRAQRVPPPRS
jgi:diguanylate cyclase (GGDEF)-like protein